MTISAPRAAFDDIADRYDDTRGGEPRGAMFAAAVDPLLGPAETVLEIGVGTALVASAMRRTGRRVIGFDISGGMLRYAGNRMPGLVAQADAMHVPLRTASVDAAYAIWVLHMVPDLDAALAEIRRVLVPGGRFVASSVNNGPGRDAISELVFAMQLSLIGGEAKRDTASELSQQAATHGLRRVEGRHQVSQSYELAPAKMADTIAARGFSNLQSVDDERWAKVVEPTVAALRALPDADQPIERRTVHDLVVFEAV